MNIRHILFAIALIGSSETWLHFLWPPFARYFERSDHSVWKVALDLLVHPELIYPDTPILAYLFIGLSIPVAMTIYYAFVLFRRYIDNSFVTISVLETRMTLTFESPDLSRSRLTRDQVYHANRSGIQAYHILTSASSSTGTIERSNIVLESRINDELITSGRPLVLGSRKSLELIERFRNPLPTSLIASLLPDNWVLGGYRRGGYKGKIVERHGEVVMSNEYNVAEPRLTLSALRYPVSDVTLAIVFPSAAAPLKTDVEAFVVRDNIARDIFIATRNEEGKVIYSVHENRFNAGSIRIYWKNRPEIAVNA